MSSQPDEISRQVAKRIGLAMSKSFSLSSEETEALFISLTEELTYLTDDQELRVEIRRRLAEARVSLLFDRSDGSEFFDRAWDEMEQAGYTSHEREATALVYRAKYLLQQKSSASELSQVFARLSNLLECQMTPEEQRVGGHFRQVLTTLRST